MSKRKFVEVRATTSMVCQGVSRAKGETFRVSPTVAKQLVSTSLATIKDQGDEQSDGSSESNEPESTGQSGGQPELPGVEASDSTGTLVENSGDAGADSQESTSQSSDANVAASPSKV